MTVIIAPNVGRYWAVIFVITLAGVGYFNQCPYGDYRPDIMLNLT